MHHWDWRKLNTQWFSSPEAWFNTSRAQNQAGALHCLLTFVCFYLSSHWFILLMTKVGTCFNIVSKYSCRLKDDIPSSDTLYHIWYQTKMNAQLMFVLSCVAHVWKRIKRWHRHDVPCWINVGTRYLQDTMCGSIALRSAYWLLTVLINLPGLFSTSLFGLWNVKEVVSKLTYLNSLFCPSCIQNTKVIKFNITENKSNKQIFVF